MTADPAVRRLVEAAARRFRPLGIAPYMFARTKLARDPVYLDVLRDDVLPSHGTVVDLGCGIGLMLSLLDAARRQADSGDWPRAWPPPPSLVLHGIEVRPRIAARATRVLGEVATIHAGDLAATTLPAADAFLVFDVLHLLPPAAQDWLLAAMTAMLRPGGVLVVREANPRGGWRFRLVQAGNRLVSILHGRAARPFHFRTIAEWRAALERLGFTVHVSEHADRSMFANAALYARRLD